MKRREFLQTSALLLALGPGAHARSEGLLPGLDERAAARLAELIEQEMKHRHIPGVSAGLIHKSGHLFWSGNFGFADLESNAAMSFDHVQNIASISKTFTTVAAMQQVEAGLLDLDRNVNDYLPFELRHPGHPDQPVTARKLMRHEAALRDGSVYARHYACGDPRMSLGTWMREYFSVGGTFYHAGENFAPWAPGDKYEYCNVSFGLLGHLVEITSGLSLPEYCLRNLFVPLGMTRTRWMIADLESGPTTTPYSWAEGNKVRGSSWGGVPLGVIKPDGATADQALPDGFIANCAYNHPNYPDGFLRTSTGQMAIWARLWLGDGKIDDVRVLRPATTHAMFTDDDARAGAESLQGLTWHSGYAINGERIWGHDGNDPGVSTSLKMARDSGLAAFVFANTDSVSPADLAKSILEAGLESLRA